MRYRAVVHLLVIFIAFQTMFYGVSYLVGNIVSVVTMLVNDPSNLSLESGSPLYFFSGLLSLLLGFIVLIRSHSITGFLTVKAGYEDKLYVSADAQQLLSMFIIFLALSSLITYLPIFLSSVFQAFTATLKHGSLSLEEQRPVDWATLLLHLLLPCLLIIFCRQLAAYFAKNVGIDGVLVVEEGGKGEERSEE